MIDTHTDIKDLSFNFPAFNASGVWCTSNQELSGLGMSEAGAIVTKSMTVMPREGNAKTRMVFNDLISVNGMGLPNHGVDYYCASVKQLRSFKKPIIASIVGFSESDIDLVFEKVNKQPFDGIEVNLSCPNVSGKSVFAYDIPLSLKILKKLRTQSKKIIGVKLPPYNQRGEIQEMAEGLVSIGVDFATLINSHPLGCIINIETESMMMKPNMGIGGLGGAVLKPIALAQVVLFHHFSKGKIGIIGVGGVETGKDIYEYILAGATAVGVATALWKYGPSVFGKLKYEFEQLLIEKKVKSLKSKIGALRFI